MKITIIGYGHVGKAMHKIFKDANIYDPYIKEFNKKENALKADIAFICVPTPQLKTGACDTSIIESILEWIDAKVIVLRSTVYVGFTDYAVKKFNKNIVFQPEYYGETVNHPFADLKNQKWLSFGGHQKSIDLAITAYQKYINSNIKIHQDTSSNVEMAKYMENAFLAMKVTFCNEMFDITKKLGADYNRVREIWLSDPRIGSSHTFVFEKKRGYSGKCLPKDIASIAFQAKAKKVDATLLNAIMIKNQKYLEK